MALDMSEIGFGVKEHWKMISMGKTLLAIATVGDKTILVSFFETEGIINSKVQITDKNKKTYYAFIENGELVEQYFYEDKDGKRITKKNDLDEYLPVVFTLPEKLKDILDQRYFK